MVKLRGDRVWPMPDRLRDVTIAGVIGRPHSSTLTAFTNTSQKKKISRVPLPLHSPKAF